MKTQIINVTPMMAMEWLKLLPDKFERDLREQYVTYLAGEMRNKRWHLIHQGISISDKKHLLDGQHRLHAIVRSGCTVPMLVATDVDEIGFADIDRGMNRSVADALRLSKDYVAIYSMIAKLALTIIRRHPLTMYKRMDSYLGEFVQDLIGKCSTHRPFLASALVRTAGIINLANGKERSYIVNLYRNLVDINALSLPPIGLAYLKHTQGIRAVDIRDSKIRRKEYAIASYVFDERNKFITRIQLSINAEDIYMQQLISVYRQTQKPD